MFKQGEAIIHPIRGAGVLECTEEREWQGSSAKYYRIKLLGEPDTSLMIPVEAAETMGLRRAIPQSKLDKVWRVLRAEPKTLPEDHKERYQLLEGKLYAGDVLQVTEAVRDMAWRQRRRGNLTTRGKRIYDEGMMLLAGEIAATQGIALADAESQVRTTLWESLSPSNTT